MTAEAPPLDKMTCKDMYNLTRQFVRKYYETLHSKPDNVWKFYDKNGMLCHLETEDHVTKYFVGLNVTFFFFGIAISFLVAKSHFLLMFWQ